MFLIMLLLQKTLKYSNLISRGVYECVARKFHRPAVNIFALASGQNHGCGVAVVRLSGASSLQIVQRLTSKDNRQQSFEPRKLYLKSLWHPLTKEKIDKGMVVWFKGPNSFTGEDVCEFHVHGSSAVLASLFNALSTFENSRYAEPGEFSRRSYLNGRMDLVEVEGLADLINSETEMQRLQALNQMSGKLSQLYENWRAEVTKSLANVEAYIDFSEEENVEDNVLVEVKHKIEKLIESIEKHLNDNRRGERLRNGVNIVIVGKPNSGKSSLLNALSNQKVAIVSPIPGTTRDIIERPLNIGGFPVVVSDTAGLRKNTSDPIEQEGIKMVHEKIKCADLIIVLVDMKAHYESIVRDGMEQFLSYHLNDMTLDLRDKQILVSLNKIDLLDEKERDTLTNECKRNSKLVINRISCNNLDSIGELLDQVKTKAQTLCFNYRSKKDADMPLLTRQRHRDTLEKCVASLRAYLNNSIDSENDKDYAIIAEDLRLAASWLGSLTGVITTEDILDVIFRDFCIGK